MARDVDLIFNLIGKDKTSPAFKSAGRSADDTRGRFDKVGVSMSKLAKLAGGLALGAGLVAGTRAVANFGIEAAQAASDLGEVKAANEQVFGAAAAAQLNAWSATAATSLGQTKTQALDAARTFGVFGKAAGLSGTDLSGFSMELTALATDMASFNNTTPEEAIEAIGAALRGEAEPMRRFGVLLDDATLKARAMEMGIYDGTGSLTQQQKVLAAHAEILAQTSDQQGDFARTSGGMANQLRQTSAIWADIKIAAGEALVPIAEQYLPIVNEKLAELLTGVQESMPEVQRWLGGLADTIIEKYPLVEQWLDEAFASVQQEWPGIKDTIGNLGDALERVGGMAQAMWSAFQSLPPEAQKIIALLAVAKTTGVLSVAFKATDLVKSLFATHVTVVGGTVTGAPGGAGSKVPKAGLAAATNPYVMAAVATGAAAYELGSGNTVRKIEEQGGNPNIVGGTYSAMGGGVSQQESGPWEWGPTKAQIEAQERYLANNRTIKEESGSPNPLANIDWKKIGLNIGFWGVSAISATKSVSEVAQQTTHVSEAAEQASLKGRLLAVQLAFAAQQSGQLGNYSQVAAGRLSELASSGQISQQQMTLLAAEVGKVGDGQPIATVAAHLQTVAVQAGLSGTELNAVTQALFGVDAAPVYNLWQSLDKVGPAAGLSAEQMAFMNAAIGNLPASTPVDVLAEAIRVAGAQAGLSDAQIQGLTQAAYGVPAAANLPQLQAAIATAGREAGFTDSQVRILSSAVWAIPAGATAEQAGEAIRIAGLKAGLSEDQVNLLTAAINYIPPNKSSTITTNAAGETANVNALQFAINSLTGKTITVGVGIQGSTGGGGPSGGPSTVKPWLDRQVDDLVDAMVPKLMASGAIGSGPWRKPTVGYVVSSEWMRGGSGVHYGIDLAAPMGTPIFAASGGRVLQAFYSNVGYGTMATIDHGGGLSTLYAHMSSLAVSPGQMVGAGQLVGLMGSTGDSTGPHLHFETKINGGAVEPRGFMAARGVYLASGGMVPVNVSAGEYLVPQSKAKGNYAVLDAINAGVINGPGGPRSDSVRGLAEPGSYVVNAAAVRRNRGLLDRLRAGSQYLAGGGVVGGGGAVFGPGVPQTVELHISGRVLYGALSDYRRESGRAVLEFTG